jgi:hypothetical protein
MAPRFSGTPQEAPKAKPRFSGKPFNPRGATSIDDILARGDAPTGKEPSLVESTIDTIGGTGAGAANLAVDTIATPVDVLQMIKQAEDRSAIGRDDSQWYNKPLTDYLFSPETNQSIKSAREGLFDTTAEVRKTVDEGVYQPKYGTGKVVKKAIPWLAPPIVAPGKAARVKQGGERLFQLAGDVIAQGALPMAAYEGVKQYVGSDVAAMLAALTTGVTASGARSIKSPEAVTARDYRGTTDRTWDDMGRLQDEQRALGLEITPAEAHAQITGQVQSGPLQTQRYLEATPIGQLKSGPMMANRGNQVEQGLNTVLDQIAPRPTDQHMIGSNVSEAGQRVIEQTRQRGNEQTAPLYQAAELDTVPQPVYDALSADPAYAEALQRLRDDKVLGQKYHNYPDNSVAVNDAVTKDLFARGEAASNRSNPEYGPHRGSLQTNAAQTARNAATQASPNYAQALAEQNQFRQGELRNVEEGPVGDFAKARDTQAVGNVMLPPKPTANDVPAMVDALTLLKQETPMLPAAARQHIDQMFMDLGGRTRSANREWVGADLAKDIAGSPAQRDRTRTVLETIGASGAAADLDRRIEAPSTTSAMSGPLAAPRLPTGWT